MPPQWTALAVLAGLAPLLAAASSPGSGTVSLPLAKQIRRGNGLERSRGIYRRQAGGSPTVQDSLVDNMTWTVGGSYYISVAVGTPPQNITAVLDTGSADLYLDAASASACQNTTSANSCRGGTYYPGGSSTYTLVGANQFSSRFGDGSTVSGDFATDTVTFGGIAVEDAQFGVATKINSTSGFAISLMGVGYSYLESSTTPYPNMPEMLHQAKAINSRLYSIYLDHVDGGTGTVLFGGIDTAKFQGGLTTLNLLPYIVANPPLVTEFVVPVTNISVVANGQAKTVYKPKGADATGLPSLLDTGSSAWTVPKDVYDSISQAFNGAVDDSNNIPCSHRSDDIQVQVVFGGLITIIAPASEYIVPLFDPIANTQYTTSDGQPLCAFMIQPDSDGQLDAQGFLTLGDAVLRSMYVVYDLDNGQVSIGQSSPGATGKTIVAVPAGPDGVSKAVGASVSVTTAAANTNSIATELQATRTIIISTVSGATDAATTTQDGSSGGRVAPGKNTTHGNNTTKTDSKADSRAARKEFPGYYALYFLCAVLFNYMMC